jgi:hypothetical protein
MAKYDIPIFVDKVLKVTTSPSLTFIGHSSGATQMLIALSGKDNEKLS